VTIAASAGAESWVSQRSMRAARAPRTRSESSTRRSGHFGSRKTSPFCRTGATRHGRATHWWPAPAASLIPEKPHLYARSRQEAAQNDAHARPAKAHLSDLAHKIALYFLRLDAKAAADSCWLASRRDSPWRLWICRHRNRASRRSPRKVSPLEKQATKRRI
jgi:hypothetical protein